MDCFENIVGVELVENYGVFKFLCFFGFVGFDIFDVVYISVVDGGYEFD